MCIPAKEDENLLAVTENTMERRKLGASRFDHINDETIRQMSGLKVIAVATREYKLRWTGHVARLRVDRWSSIIRNWLPLKENVR